MLALAKALISKCDLFASYVRLVCPPVHPSSIYLLGGATLHTHLKPRLTDAQGLRYCAGSGRYWGIGYAARICHHRSSSTRRRFFSSTHAGESGAVRPGETMEKHEAASSWP